MWVMAMPIAHLSTSVPPSFSNVPFPSCLDGAFFRYVVNNGFSVHRSPPSLLMGEESIAMATPIIKNVVEQESFYRTNGLVCRFSMAYDRDDLS